MTTGALTEPREEVASVVDLDADSVPARVYLPAGEAAGGLIWCHGGGFVYGDPGVHDAHARRMANRTGRAVLYIHYRRAPEDPFPAAVDDVRAASDWWLREGAAASGVDPADQVMLGDSAGANLALGLALRDLDRYAALVLVYPFLDPHGSTYDAARDNEELSLATCDWFWRAYAPDPADWADPDLDPLQAASFEGLPRTLVQVAEHDVLTSSGEALAARLRQEGVEVSLELYPGVHHGFWRRFDNDQAEPAQDDLVRFLVSRVESS